jgi:hypothetical protein
MNKVDLNRKIQLLEESIVELKKANHNLLHCECESCAQVRKTNNKRVMRNFNVLSAMLSKFYGPYSGPFGRR